MSEFVLDDVPGWFDYADIYDAMVERFGDGSHFVEIGTWKGRSACHMAQAIQASGKHIRFSVIDVFAEPRLLEIFCTNLAKAGVLEMVEIYQGRSQAAANYEPLAGPFEFVWIDGSHAFNDVYQDMSVWYPKVREGGVLAGHDYKDWQFSPQVRPAVDQWTTERKIPFREWGTSWVIEKRPSVS